MEDKSTVNIMELSVFCVSSICLALPEFVRSCSGTAIRTRFAAKAAVLLVDVLAAIPWLSLEVCISLLPPHPDRKWCWPSLIKRYDSSDAGVLYEDLPHLLVN